MLAFSNFLGVYCWYWFHHWVNTRCIKQTLHSRALAAKSLTILSRGSAYSDCSGTISSRLKVLIYMRVSILLFGAIRRTDVGDVARFPGAHSATILVAEVWKMVSAYTCTRCN
jgi:hypothetical protein